MIEPTPMEDKEYFKAKGVSKSLLAKMDCPDKLWIPTEEAPAMLSGTLAHCAILEPDEFSKRYIVDPKMPKRSNADKEAWQAWQEANDDKRVITQVQYDESMYMAEAIRNHPRASELLSGGIAEQAYFWDDERTGAKCKCKADYVQGDMLVDLKTCASASPSEFARACANFKYHWQDSWYSRGTGAERFLFIAIEKKAPYVIEIYELDDIAKETGLIQCDKALDKYLFHKDFEPYYGYTGNRDITELRLPQWAL